MMWVAIFGGIVMLALVQTALLVWWLWRKSRSLVGELGVLSERADELADLLGQVHLPDTSVRESRLPDAHDD